MPREQPCLLLGDMNEWLSWSRHLTWLHDRLGQVLTPATFPSRRPFLRLDRLWLRPRGALREIEAWHSAEARVASDHLPLRALVEIDPPAAAPATAMALAERVAGA